MFLQQLEEELVISIWKWNFFPSFISGALGRRLQLFPRIVSQEGSGWLFVSPGRFRIPLFPHKVQDNCLFFPGRFRLAVCFPDDCAILPAGLLIYFLYVKVKLLLSLEG